MTPARLALLAATAGIAALVVVGLLELGGGSSGERSERLTPAAMQARLRGSPPQLAALHAQAAQLLPGGLAALRTRLAALHGTPVVLNKWASWCVPCRAEFGAFQHVGVQSGHQVAFIGIDSGDTSKGAAESFLRSFPVAYPSYYDASGQAGAALTDSAFTPVTVFIDRRGARVHPPGALSGLPEARTRRAALRAGRLRRCRSCASTRSAGTGRSSPASAAGARAESRGASPPSRSTLRRIRSPRATRTGRRRSSTRCDPGGGPPDSPGWTVRVVPNLYPALAPRGDGAPPAPAEEPGEGGRGAPELFAALPATGAHEVVINGPQPVLSLADLPVEQVVEAVSVWRERMRVHDESAYVQLIVNERREAGASLPHTHAQLYALDFVPAAVARERERAGAYTTRTMGQSLLGDLVAEEVRRGERIVAIDEEAVLMAPFASRLPFQLMLAPRVPRPRFEEDGPTGAALLHDGLRRLARRLGANPPLNMWIRTAPRGAEQFCWRIDVMPRLTHLAGLELATELNLNIVAPEDAARLLREA